VPPPSTPPTEHSGTAYDWAERDPRLRTPEDATAGASAEGTVGTLRRDRARRGLWRFPGIPWTRMLFIGVVCFGLWFLLDAPSLQRSASISPVGTRRTVSLDVVGPVAALSRSLGLSHVVGWTDELLGRTPGGGPSLSPADPGHRPSNPQGPVVTPPGVAAVTTTTLPVLNLRPSAADPLRVLVVGDSLGLDLGQPLVDVLGMTGEVVTTLDARIDTGLTRPDYFDWPAELRIDLANQRPELVVVMMGANDAQSLVDGGRVIQFGTPAWNADYGRRLGAFIDEANAGGAHVLWVGMPPMASPQLNAQVQDLNAVARSQVAGDPRLAVYLSSVKVLGNAQGGFSTYLTDTSGAEIAVRTPDGVHLTPGGGARLAAAVVAAARADLHIRFGH
jgi:uncharacterized protein